MRLGELGKNSKIDGLITSPREVAKLRQKLGDDITLVTPGVRPAWAEANDQKRFTTPKEALKNGADYLLSDVPSPPRKTRGKHGPSAQRDHSIGASSAQVERDPRARW